ncbi:MAG: hypothetical protein AAF604_18550 [Acidobacteriota bacterium]
MLQAITRGEIHPSALVEVIVEHLLQACPACRTEIEAWRENPTGENPDYGSVFDRLIAGVRDQTERIEDERLEAQQDFDELQKVPPAERGDKILQAHKRFRSHLLADLLLTASREGIPADPAHALHFAELAELVACRCPSTALGTESQVRALANQANAQRCLGNPQKAHELFGQARSLMRTKGVTDKLVYAEIDSFEGSLRTDQRRYRQADMLLRRATMHYRLARDDEKVASTLLQLANLNYYQQKLDKAIASIKDALTSLAGSDNSRLLLMAHYNLAVYQNEAGEQSDAAATLRRAHRLAVEFGDDWTQLRLRWLEGKIARDLDDAETAESALLEVREGFIAAGSGYDAAMASLDLAVLYAQQGQARPIRQLAEEMMPIFEAEDVHREAMAALILFQEAARQEVVNIAMAKEVLDYLDRARQDPTLKYREPS